MQSLDSFVKNLGTKHPAQDVEMRNLPSRIAEQDLVSFVVDLLVQVEDCGQRLCCVECHLGRSAQSPTTCVWERLQRGSQDVAVDDFSNLSRESQETEDLALGIEVR